MSWRSITVDDIRTALSGDELQSLQESALAAGQIDPLLSVIEQVTDEVRGFIAAYADNSLGPAQTLPPQVTGSAIAIVRWRLAGRLSVGKAGELLRSESRKQDYDDAVQLLRDVAEGKVAVEEPDETGPEVMPESSAAFGGETKIDFLT